MIVHGDKKRLDHSKTVFSDGDFAYKLEPEWAQWPDELQGTSVVGGCFDENDNLYLTTRFTKDSPVVMFGPDGKYIKSIGAGLFSNFLHGISYTSRGTLLCADCEQHVVREIDTSGNLLGIVDDLIYRPAEIWSNKEYVFVGEMDGGITILDHELKILAQLGFWYSTLTVHGICGDSKGNLYVSSLWLHQGDNIKQKGNEIMKLVRI